MKEGIYVKDVMQRGPAAESKHILPGNSKLLFIIIIAIIIITYCIFVFIRHVCMHTNICAMCIRIYDEACFS